MDVLSDAVAALRTGRPHSGVFVRHGTWGRRYPHLDGAGFHVVLEGGCWLLPPGAEPVELGVGDVVLLRDGVGHGLADRPDSPLTEIVAPDETRVVEGPGARAAVLCGVYELTRDRSHPLLADLPDVVHLPAVPGRHPSLRATVDLLAAELGSHRPGADAAIPALLEAMLLYILRAWFDDQPGGGWAGVFRDPATSTALRGIHADPARPWTVGDLAATAGLSRAAFARRFTAMVGEPPLTYLTRWRMITAARYLRDSPVVLSTVARRVGYTSEFAFAKAFKRAHGTAPGRYRQQSRDLPAFHQDA